MDLWKLDKSRLPSRQGKAAKNTGCDKSFQGHVPASGHQDSIVHGDSIIVGKLRGIDVTVADVFEPTGQKTSSANVIVASGGGMISPPGAVLDLKLPESERVRLSNARTTAEINCISTAFEYAQQAGPAWRESVTGEGATVEVVCHANL